MNLVFDAYFPLSRTVMPFTQEEFFEIFVSYNESIYPVQFVFMLIASAIAAATLRSGGVGRAGAGFLAVLWLCSGIVYHLIFFSSINRAAYLFGVAFIGQACVLFYAGFIKGLIRFRFRPGAYGYTGFFLIVYSLIVYPAIGYFGGRAYPANPTFGAPCPTVIFTLGLLLLNAKRVPLYIWALPLLWSVIGSTAAFVFDVSEDIGLLAAALSVGYLLWRRRRIPQGVNSEGFSPG
jgi:hypothetical protein